MDFSRLNYYLSRDQIENKTLAVIGCGAIGRAVASMLGRLGPKTIFLVDDDTIDEHNIPAQNWRKSQIGMPKVQALAEEIEDQTSDVEIIPLNKRWTPIDFFDKNIDYLWSTVDNIDTRRAIFDFHKDRLSGFFDVRIGPAVAQMFFVDTRTEESRGWYEKTLFPSAEAHRHGCVQPMSNFIAGIAAGHSVNTFVSAISNKNWLAPAFMEYNAISQTTISEDPIEYFQSMS